MLLRLALSNLASRKARALLTMLAIAISVALVVAMTSGFKAFESAASGFLDRYMGAVDAEIVRTNDPSRGIDQSLLDELRSDPQVRLAFPRLHSDAPLPNAPSGTTLLNRTSLVGVDRATDPLLDWMKLTAGRWFRPDERACVIDQGVRDKTGLNIGDTLKLTGARGSLELPIVGVVHKPGLFASFTQTVYAPLEAAQTFVYGSGAPPRLSRIRVQFVPGADETVFAERWNRKLAAIDPLLKLKLSRASREEIDRNFLGLRLLSILGGAVTLLAATFIIFSTLSMGVVERQRVLAMLRAIGMTRGQVARLVLAEGLSIAAGGIAAGVPIGYGLSAIVVWMLRSMFDLSPTIDWLGVGIATVAALLTAGAAGLLPAWQASRVDPLEAMSPLAGAAQDRFPWKMTFIALLLVGIDPLLLFFPFSGDFERPLRFYSHFAVGLPALMIGFFLLSPAFVWTLTRFAGPLVSALLAVPFAVVRQQLSGGLWRSAGTCTALMVGLAVLVVMQTQGNSSLNSWKLPQNFPDVFIFTRNLNGLNPQAQAQIRASNLLIENDVMPIGAFSPEVPFMGLIGTQLPGNTMFVAVDPDKAFRLMELDFRQGNAEEAARLLKQGRHIVVTEELRRLKKVGLGDTIQLKSRSQGTLDYRIAGVVWSPGIDVMVNSFDMSQQYEQQSQACVFGTLADARQDFGVENVHIVCANFRQLGVPKEELIGQLQEQLKDQAISVADVRQLKSMIQNGLRKLLNVASSVAWGALLVAGLGVTNTVIASIRSRMWQFGVLRSIGLTRSALLRIVLAEAILLGVIGAAMGLTCGFLLALDARQMMTITIGHHPPLSIPWDIITLGAGVVIGISLLASILPAIRVSRTEPLALLQAGRSAA